MLRILLIALIGYFIFSRLFGRIVIIRHKENNFGENDHNQEPKIKITDNREISDRSKDGDYIDYEEIK